MAYVVARPNGRFEIRESEHTPKGPRARTLASCRVLTESVLAVAADKARRPFDAQSVLLSAARAGAPVEQTPPTEQEARTARSAFVAASRRMARTTSRPRPDRAQVDPGAALIELLGFADAVACSQPQRPASPLAFPPLARLAQSRARRARRVSAKSRR